MSKDRAGRGNWAWTAILSSLLGGASLVLGLLEWLAWPSLLAPGSAIAGLVVALGSYVYLGLRSHAWTPHATSLTVSFLSGCAIPVAALLVAYPFSADGAEPLARFIPLGGVATSCVILAGLRQGLRMAGSVRPDAGGQPAAAAAGRPK